MPHTMPSAASDMPADTWIDRVAPAGIRPYFRLARFDRPIGVWLLLLPCWWGVALGSPGWPSAWLFVLFAVGAIVMRGAGCTFNDIVDRDFDGRVARTALRPIPHGDVSVWQAILWMVALSLVGLAVLLQFNGFTVALGVASLLLVAVYPFMKRVTYWPQAFLGLTFNWGALMGWTAVQGQLDPPAVVLYGAGFLWTLGYDTIYAHQDKEDDVLIGVKSTALRLGARTKPWVSAFYVGTIAAAAVAGSLAGLSWVFFGFLALTALHFAWQVATLDTNDPANCLRRFKSNRDAGAVLLLGIVLDHAL